LITSVNYYIKHGLLRKIFLQRLPLPYLDELYDYAIENGAIGGKLLGAGGGGYFLFYVPTFRKIRLIKALKKKDLIVDTFTFDNKGLRSWITKEKNNGY